MGYNGTAEYIKGNEGYRHNTYLDTEGNLTGGYGCHLREGLHLPHYVWLRIFDYQFRLTIGEYESLKLDLDPIRERVVVDLIYNLGLSKLLTFKNFMTRVRYGDYPGAAAELKYRDPQRSPELTPYYTQTGGRARRNYHMMLTGEEWKDGD